MKTKFLPLFVACIAAIIPGMTAMSQEASYEINIPAQRTIVRSMGKDSCLTYAESGGAKIIVVSTQLTNGAAEYHADFLPSIGVNDIDILKSDNRFYFCGVKPGGLPFFGTANLFNTSGVLVNYQYGDLFMVFNNYAVSSLSKLKVYGTSDGGVHVIMTGSCYQTGNPNVKFSCIIDAYAPSPSASNWTIALYTLGKIDWQFHDVAVSDNRIAVVGQTFETMRPQRVFFFDKPMVSTTNMFATTPAVWYATGNFKMLDSAAVVHCDGDLFATASHATDNSGLDGLLVSVYDCTGPIPSVTWQKIFSPTSGGYSFGRGVKDMAYYQKMLYIQQDMADSLSNTIDAVYMVDIYGWPQCRYNINTSETHHTSLDANLSGSQRAVVAGITTSSPTKIVLHRFDFSNYSKNCSDNLPLNETKPPFDAMGIINMEPYINITTIPGDKVLTAGNTMTEICN